MITEKIACGNKSLIPVGVGEVGQSRTRCNVFICNGQVLFLIEVIVNVLFQLILDRISKGVHDKVSRGSDLTQALFNFAYKYKCIWTKRGFDTPLMNRYVFVLPY
jgi:hypothetical protein